MIFPILFFQKKIFFFDIFWTFHTNMFKTLKLFFDNRTKFFQNLFSESVNGNLELYQKIFFRQLRHNQSRNIDQSKPINNLWVKKYKFHSQIIIVEKFDWDFWMFLKSWDIFNTFAKKSWNFSLGIILGEKFRKSEKPHLV